MSPQTTPGLDMRDRQNCGEKHSVRLICALGDVAGRPLHFCHKIHASSLTLLTPEVLSLDLAALLTPAELNKLGRAGRKVDNFHGQCHFRMGAEQVYES